MLLIELIIDILDSSGTPLKQGEILSIAETHRAYQECDESTLKSQQSRPN